MQKTISIFLLSVVATIGLPIGAAAQGPAAWYRFDETSGTLAYDSSGNGNTAYVEGGATWSGDVDTSRLYDTGPSCIFLPDHDDVTSQAVRAPHSDTLNAGLGGVSMCFFVKIDPPFNVNMRPKAVFILKGSLNANDGNPPNPNHLGKRYEMYYKYDLLNLVVDDGDALNHKVQYQSAVDPGIVTGNWVHVVGTVDMVSQQAHLYLDGVEIPGTYAVANWPTESIDEPSDLCIGNSYVEVGGDTYPDAFTGLMDDVRIYTRALSAEEIAPPFPFPTPTPTPTPYSAMAPIIRDLPDIVIGDVGDVLGAGTTARRLFRYLNVFNLFDETWIVWRNEGFPAEAKHAYLYRNTATDPIDIRASKPTEWVDTLTDAQYTALLAGNDPGGNTNMLDAATTFGFLSLMNRDIEAGSPPSAYAADPMANGLTTTEIAALTPDPLGVTDLVLAAVEVTDEMFPTTTTLVATKDFTVYTLMDWEDMIPSLPPSHDWDFLGGSRQGWVGQSNPAQGIAHLSALPVTTETTITDGAIGFDASAPHSGYGWGVWKTSNDGVNPQFIVPSADKEDLVMRVRATLVTETAATRESCLSYRFNVQNLFGNHWSGVLVPSLATGADTAQIDCPAGGDPLEVQIHWAVPYDLNEYADDGLLATTDWQALIPHPSVPADGRDYVIQWDGIDDGDTYDLLMDSCVVESYPRPADKPTPDLEWGGGGGSEIPFNDPVNGFVATPSCPFDGIDIGTADIQAGYAEVSMGTVTSHPKWQQISQDVTTVTQTVAEAGNDLVRYTATYNCGTSADTAPNIRFQTTTVRNNPTSWADVDATVWYDNLVPMDFLNNVYGNGVSLNPAVEDAPGTPKTAAEGGSTIDIYRYTMNTIPATRVMRWYWDAYGATMPGTWPDETGSLRVTHIVVNAGLANP